MQAYRGRLVMSDRVQRPFWLHQLAEYLIGFSMVAVSVQLPTPVVPVALGGLVIVNAAIVNGPMSAFDVVSRKVHRWIDVVLIAAIAVVAVLPWFDIDVSSRSILLLIAAVLAVVWWYSSFETRPERGARRVRDASERADEIGRRAGRLVGDGVNAWRRRKRDDV